MNNESGEIDINKWERERERERELDIKQVELKKAMVNRE